MLGADGIAVVGFLSLGRLIAGGKGEGRAHVEQFTYLTCNFVVEVEKKLPFPFKEGLQIVGIILKERTLSIGRQ